MKKSIVFAAVSVFLTVMLVGIGWSEKVELPKKLTATVPEYAGATVVSSMQMGTNWHGALETEDSPTDVIQFYKKAMTAKGWGVFMEMQQTGTAAVGLNKDNMQLMVGAEKSGDKTSFTLSLIEQEQ